MQAPNDVRNAYIHFRDDSRADLIPVSEAFWDEVVAGHSPGARAGQAHGVVHLFRAVAHVGAASRGRGSGHAALGRRHPGP